MPEARYPGNNSNSLKKIYKRENYCPFEGDSSSSSLAGLKPTTMSLSSMIMTGTIICFVFSTMSLAASLSDATSCSSKGIFFCERYSLALVHQGQVGVE